MDRCSVRDPRSHRGLRDPERAARNGLYGELGVRSLTQCIYSNNVGDLNERDWYFIAKQPAPAPHLHIQRDGRATLRIVIVTLPCVGRSCEHFSDGFHLHLQQTRATRGLTPSQDLIRWGARWALSSIDFSIDFSDLDIVLFAPAKFHESCNRGTRVP